MSDNKNEPKSKNTLKIAIIIGIIVVVLGGGSFAGYMLVFAKKQPANNAAANNAMAMNNAVANGQTANGQVVNGQVIMNGSNQFIVVSKFNYDLGEFLVNLNDEGGKKYLKAKIVVGYDNKKMPKELDEKKIIMRDAVISVLRTKKAADFTAKGVEDLKTEILKKINPLLTTGQCNNVYFPEILVQ